MQNRKRDTDVQKRILNSVGEGCFERTALKHVYYQGWNRSPAQAGCMRQVLRPGALGWGIHVNPWLIHVNVWQKPLQFCKVVSLQLIKINEKRKEKKSLLQHQNLKPSILRCSAFLMVQLSHWYMTTGKKTEPLPKRSCFLILSYERRAGLQHMIGGTTQTFSPSQNSVYPYWMFPSLPVSSWNKDEEHFVFHLFWKLAILTPRPLVHLSMVSIFSPVSQTNWMLFYQHASVLRCPLMSATSSLAVYLGFFLWCKRE